MQARGCSSSCSGNQLWKLVPDQVSAGSMRCSACLPLSICVKSKGLKTKISHAHSLILCLSVLLCLSFYSYLCLFLCILCNCYRFPSPSPSLFQSCCCVSFPEISLTPKFHLMIFEHQRLMQVGLAAVCLSTPSYAHDNYVLRAMFDFMRIILFLVCRSFLCVG